MSLTPLVFKPHLVERVWGGRQLQTVLGKDLPEDGPFGESWEVSAHPSQPSAVAAGPLAGKTIAELCAEYGTAFMGTALAGDAAFPLLFKYLDAAAVLSVQVHPDDAYAREHENGQLGKAEAWYVLASAAGGAIYHGLVSGTTRESFRDALASGRVGECLRKVSVQAGDCFYQPPGTVHAIGSGVLLAEIQQSSDLTYRVYDWGRVGLDGKPRELHIDKALDVIDFSPDGANFAPAKIKPAPINVPGTRHAELLVDSERFRFERLEFQGDARLESDPERFWLLAVAGGRGVLRAGEISYPLDAGKTCLIPASAGAFDITNAVDLSLLRAFVSGS